MAQEGDLLLVHVENNPAFFARIECISPDVKPEWYQLSLLVLQVPLIEVTWILREEYINGGSFTMGGKKIFLEVVEAPGKEPPQQPDRIAKEAGAKQHSETKEDRGKVISLFDRE
jgi:hypothetical protein